jgi:hypothetical protein
MAHADLLDQLELPDRLRLTGPICGGARAADQVKLAATRGASEVRERIVLDDLDRVVTVWAADLQGLSSPLKKSLEAAFPKWVDGATLGQSSD